MTDVLHHRPTGGRRVAKSAVAASMSALLVSLAACDAGAPPPTTNTRPAADVPREARMAQAAPETPAVSSPSTPLPSVAAPLRWELHALGDIERPDGRVERSYRVTLHNGGLPLPGLLAVVTPAAAGVQVQQGLLVLGDMAAGAARSARGSLTLVHAEDWVPQPGDLAWSLSADAALHDSAGALLPGASDAPATTGLRDWQPALPPGWRVQASLNPDARLADVNQALRRQQLRVAQMRPGNHTLWLVPVGSATEDLMQRAAQALPASGAFLHARALPPPAGPGAGATPGTKDTGLDPHACQD